MKTRDSSFYSYFTVFTTFMIIQKFRDVLVIFQDRYCTKVENSGLIFCLILFYFMNWPWKGRYRFSWYDILIYQYYNSFAITILFKEYYMFMYIFQSYMHDFYMTRQKQRHQITKNEKLLLSLLLLNRE